MLGYIDTEFYTVLRMENPMKLIAEDICGRFLSLCRCRSIRLLYVPWSTVPPPHLGLSVGISLRRDGRSGF